MMERIHKEFQPGGLLYEKLDDSTPFRRKGMEKTVRGRSWAIYDGIFVEAFDEEWESPKMYKMLERDLRSIRSQVRSTNMTEPKIKMSIPPRRDQMSNEAQMTKCQNIFPFAKQIEDYTFSTLGFGFHLIPLWRD